MATAGLITFHFAHHYGAQLQAYATMRVVQQLGRPCEIIDYRLPHTTRTNQIFQKGLGPRTIAQNIHTAIHRQALQKRHDRFEAFVEKRMILSERRYETLEALQKHPPIYDAYIAGSDQIWSPSIFADGRFDPAFFLTFVRQGQKISYASSFGGTAIPERMQEELSTYLSSFDAVSAREKQAQEVLEGILKRPVPAVLDPTLLLDGQQWSKISARPARTGPYILCYFISDYSNLMPYLEAIEEQTGYPIVQLAGMRRQVPGADELILDAGPAEFLGLFEHAAYVVTNSFHGTVFAMQFNKPFYTAVSPKERMHPDKSRIYHLLDLGGLLDRLVDLPMAAEPDREIDYDEVHRRLHVQRAASIVYLGNALLAGEKGSDAPFVPVPKRAEGREIKLAGVLDCTGCSACLAVCPLGAISMEADREGFLRPVIGENCMRCGKCMEHCPALAKKEAADEGPDVYAAWNKEDKIRKESTSGGIFTALAKEVLREGGVVYGAAFDEEFVLRHIPVEDETALERLRGAKYVQSDLGDTFAQVQLHLEQGRKVLFSGTPCQTAGLVKALEGPDDNLLICDIVCHGVPSPAVWEQYRRSMEGHLHKKLMAVSFRSKEDGWSKSKFAAEFGGKHYYIEPLVKTTYGRGFGMALFLRPSCYRCPYGGGKRYADLTLGDFWGVSKEALPPEANIEAGISLVLTHTEKGKAALEGLGDAITRVERPLEEALSGNPRLKTPIGQAKGRTAFFRDFISLPYEETEKKWLSQPSLPYRIGAKVLSPEMKAKLRKLLGR